MEEARKEFETWAGRYFSGITFYEFERLEGGRGDYRWEPMQHAWDCWQASREVVLTAARKVLGTHSGAFRNSGLKVMVQDAIEALRSGKKG